MATTAITVRLSDYPQVRQLLDDQGSAIKRLAVENEALRREVAALKRLNGITASALVDYRLALAMEAIKAVLDGRMA